MFDELLKKFEAPNHPYILFGKQGAHTDMAKKIAGEKYIAATPKLFCLDASGGHAHPDRINQYILKGYKLLKWDFSKANLDRFKGATNFGDDVDHYKILDGACKRAFSTSDARVKELEAEVAALKKDSVMEKKIEKAKAEAAK
jgi:hypothetical protein